MKDIAIKALAILSSPNIGTQEYNNKNEKDITKNMCNNHEGMLSLSS